MTNPFQIVFVASNFIGEEGDLAILDDIEVSFDRDPNECPLDPGEEGAALKTVETSSSASQIVSLGSNAAGASESEVVLELLLIILQAPANNIDTAAFSGASGTGASASAINGGSESSSSRRTEVTETEETVEETSGGARAHGKKTSEISTTSKTSCLSAKCTFEEGLFCFFCAIHSGTTCSYKDAYHTESIKGITTKFQVVTGQFKNKVTGVKESSGNLTRNVHVLQKVPSTPQPSCIPGKWRVSRSPREAWKETVDSASSTTKAPTVCCSKLVATRWTPVPSPPTAS